MSFSMNTRISQLIMPKSDNKIGDKKNLLNFIFLKINNIYNACSVNHFT